MNNKDKLIARFKKIKEKGFVKSNRSNSTGVGKTFEDHMGIKENNINKPDLYGYEIKTHRDSSSNYITLFTKSPSFPKGANTLLRTQYGTPAENNSELKILHTSLFADRANTFASKYSFQIANDKANKVVKIIVRNKNNNKILNDICGYTYEEL